MKRSLIIVSMILVIFGYMNGGYTNAAETVTTMDTEIVGAKPSIDGNIVAFSASECRPDGTLIADLDNNGAFDWGCPGDLSWYGVLGYIDLADGNRYYNTGISIYCSPSVDNGVISFVRTEDILNEDLDGDNVIEYNISRLFLYDTNERRLIDTGQVAYDCPAPDISNGEVVFTANEQSFGPGYPGYYLDPETNIGFVDLNGNGQPDWTLVGIYDMSTGGVTWVDDNEAHDFPSIDNSIVTYPDPRYGYLYEVPVVYNLENGQIWDIPGALLCDYPNVEGNVVTFLGSPDLEGLGSPDQLYYYDIVTHTLIDTGIVGSCITVATCTIKSGDRILFYGTDSTLNIYNMATGENTQTGVATYGGCDVFRDHSLSGTVGAYRRPEGTIGLLYIVPDLIETMVSGPASASSGENIVISDTAINQGTNGSGPFYVAFYLSTDATITTGDTFLGGRWVPGLASGESSHGSTNGVIPASVTPGTYSLGAIADYNNQILENDDNNNALAGSSITISVGMDTSPIQSWAVQYNGAANLDDYSRKVVTDSFGNVYVAGYSYTGNPGDPNTDYTTMKYDSLGNLMWARTYDNGGYDDAVDLVVDSSGNVYVTGYSDDGVESDYTTIKYDGAGNQLWIARYENGIPEAIEVDVFGNVYVAGTIWGGANSDYAIVKYDFAGNQLCVARYDSGGSDNATAFKVDTLGNMYITGSIDTGTHYDYATARFDSACNPLWESRYDNGGSDYASDLAVDANGNVYVTGGSSGNSTGSDYATLKYSPDGNQVWVARYDNGPSDGAIGLVVDTSGNVYVTGQSFNGMNWDYATIKYSAAGSQVWVARYDNGGNDFPASLSIDGSGNVYVAGPSSNGMNQDFATVKYDTSGNQVWVKRYDSGGDDYIGYEGALTVDASENVYITGYSGPDIVTVKYASRTPAIISYGEGTVMTPRYRTWDGTAYSSEVSALSVGATVRWSVLKQNPLRNEAILGVLDNTNDINLQVWNGTAWGNLIEVTASSSTSATRAFDVAYEQLSGRALVVYNDGTSTPKYRIWNGNVWSAQSSVPVTRTTGSSNWIRLEAKPSSNEIILAYQDRNADVNALLWNGSGWGSEQLMETAVGSSGKVAQSFDVAYERQSGRGMVIWSQSGTSVLQYRVWNGTSWSGENAFGNPGQMGTSGTTNIYFVRLVADPASNQLAVGTSDANSDFYVQVWSGSAWGGGNRSVAVLTNDLEFTSTQREFDLAWEWVTGKVVAVYDKKASTNSAGFYKTWTVISGWSSSEGSLPAGALDPVWVQLRANPNTNEIFVGFLDKQYDINIHRWNGSSWGNSIEVETASAGGVYTYESFMITYLP